MKIGPCMALAAAVAAGAAAPVLAEQSAADLRRLGNEAVRAVTRPATLARGAAEGCAADGNSTAEAGAQVFSNTWQSDGYTTFQHVIEGAPGKVNLVLNACTSASGGETVAVYRVDAQGVRKTPRIMSVIATLRGNARSASVTLARPPRGEQTSRLPIMIVVENASGREHTGEYRLTATR